MMIKPSSPGSGRARPQDRAESGNLMSYMALRHEGYLGMVNDVTA
jgi:hypothetical protein